MTSTGTYAFDPSGGDLALFALAHSGIEAEQVKPSHIRNAIMAANLVNVDFTNKNPNQYSFQTITQQLAAATATYTLSARIASVAFAYLTNDSSDDSRHMTMLSAAQYARITDKTQTGTGPTSYFVSLLKTPTLSVWPLIAVDDDVTYTVNLLVLRQNQDFEVKDGTTTDLPYRFLDAFAMGLTHRLALIYAPDRADRFEGLYERKFGLAAAQDQEDVPITIMPDLTSYR